MPSLDPASRRALRWFALRLAAATATAATLAAVAADPAAQFLRAFQLLCLWASLLAAALALAGGAGPGRGTLGFRDEAVAFGALALLAHAAGVLLAA